ncbi:hypothetical protein GCT19_38900 [Paraburkholderia sp. CNPSo 3155]|nr:hypothetical protein [Paraburkholderia atlantica]
MGSVFAVAASSRGFVVFWTIPQTLLPRSSAAESTRGVVRFRREVYETFKRRDLIGDGRPDWPVSDSQSLSAASGMLAEPSGVTLTSLRLSG